MKGVEPIDHGGNRMNLRFSGFVVRKNLFEEFDATDGRVEVEEDGQRESHSLDDDPGHESVESGFDNVCSYL
jgi:hypothetical protein